jgi:DNA-binding MarR family transcriptional regulator
LETRGCVATAADPDDGRRKRLVVTECGFDVLREGEAVITDLREQWAAEIGVAQLEALENRLAELVRQPTVDDAPGWMS